MNSAEVQANIITDSTLMETVQHGTQDYRFAFYNERMAQFDFFRIDWHWHTELEFVYISSGTVRVNISGEEIFLSAGQGIFINSKVLHRFTAEADAAIPNFLFHPVFIAPFGSLIYRSFVFPVIDSAFTHQVFSPDIAWQDRILCLMREIISLQPLPENALLSSSLLQKLWSILFTGLKDSLCEPPSEHAASVRARLQIMLSYIHEHYAEDISLSDIARHALLSKSTVLSLFKSQLKISPVNYLIQYRLSRAAEQLLSSEKKAGRYLGGKRLS